MLFAKTQKKKKEGVTRSGAQSEASAAGGIAQVSQIESETSIDLALILFGKLIWENLSLSKNPCNRQQWVRLCWQGQELQTKSGRYPSFSSPSGHRSRIAVRSRGTIFLLDADEVLAVKARRNCVILQGQPDSKMLRGQSR
jgi:hypothetical protein